MTTPTTPENPAAPPDSRSHRLTSRLSLRHAEGEGRPPTDRLRSYAATAGDTLIEWRRLAQPVLGPVGAVLGCVSTLGWLVAAAALGSWFVGWTLGWQEFMYAAAGLLVLLALSSLLTIGRMSLEVRTRLQPQRVTAGDGAAVEVWVRNTGRAPLLPLPLDMPTGQTVTRFNLPALVSGSEFEDLVVMPTQRRGVFVVGPATTLRGDPFGLMRRQVTWTDAVELFVHPRTVFLDSLGTGLLKDLEGRSTNDVSMSDLAFHTLREYAPGDDRRHIHWLSSARRSGASGSAQFMVRQFLDTRRSHLGVVVDCDQAAWLDEDEFETAVSVGASVAARSLLDGMDVSEASGQFVLTRPRRHAALDLFSRVRLGPEALESVVARLARAAPTISAAVIVTGPLTSFQVLRRAISAFSPDVNVVGVRVEHGATAGLQRSSGLSILTIGSLGDLPRALSGRLT